MRIGVTRPKYSFDSRVIVAITLRKANLTRSLMMPSMILGLSVPSAEAR